MKKIFIFGAFLLALASCERDEIIYSGPSFVQFEESLTPGIEVQESGEFVEIQVSLSKKSTQDIVVNFTYTDSTAVEDVDYTAISSVVIPAGEYSTILTIPIIDNSTFNENKIFDVSILSISDNSFQIGFNDEGTKRKRITIVDDDCQVKTSYMDWAGNLQLVDVGYSTTTGTAVNATCDILNVRGDLTGLGVNINFKIEFTPSDSDPTVGTVIVPLQNTGYQSGGIPITASGTGTYNSQTGEIIIDYNSGGPANFTYPGTTIITKN